MCRRDGHCVLCSSASSLTWALRGTISPIVFWGKTFIRRVIDIRVRTDRQQQSTGEFRPSDRGEDSFLEVSKEEERFHIVRVCLTPEWQREGGIFWEGMYHSEGRVHM